MFDNEPEEQLAVRMTVEDALSHLAPDEQRILRESVEGYEDAATRRLARRVEHKLASLLGVQWRCPECREAKPASHFGWNAPMCLACEPSHRRYRRAQFNRWLNGILRQQTWQCTQCGESKPVRDFEPTKPRRGCRACRIQAGENPEPTRALDCPSCLDYPTPAQAHNASKAA